MSKAKVLPNFVITAVDEDQGVSTIEQCESTKLVDVEFAVVVISKYGVEASWVPFRLLNTQHLHVRCTVTGSGVDRGTALTDRDRADRVTVAHHGSGPATATGTPSGPELKVFARSRGGSWTCLSMGCGRRSKGRRKAKAHNALVACLARISGIPETMLNSGVNFRYIRNL